MRSRESISTRITIIPCGECAKIFWQAKWNDVARRSLRSIGEEDGPPCFTSIFSNLIITFRNVAEKNGSIGGGRIDACIAKLTPRTVTSAPSSPLKAVSFTTLYGLITARWRAQATPTPISLLQLEYPFEFPISIARPISNQISNEILPILGFAILFFSTSPTNSSSRADIWSGNFGENRSNSTNHLFVGWKGVDRTHRIVVRGGQECGRRWIANWKRRRRNSIALHCYPHYNAYSRSWITVTIGASSTASFNHSFLSPPSARLESPPGGRRGRCKISLSLPPLPLFPSWRSFSSLLTRSTHHSLPSLPNLPLLLSSPRRGDGKRARTQRPIAISPRGK